MAVCAVLAFPGSIVAQESFNVLEAISIDASGALELFGEQAPQGPESGIPFRQVLAEALRNTDAPQFSLDSDFSQFTREKLAGKRMEELFHSAPGVLSPFGRAALEALEIPLPASGKQDFTALLLLQAGFSLPADLHQVMAPGETMPSAATRGQWVRLLGLTDHLRAYLDSMEQNPSDKDGASDRFYAEFLQGLSHSMAPHPPRLLVAYRQARDKGSAPDQALGAALRRFLEAYNHLTVRAVDILLERHHLAAVILDADALERALGVTPLSRPRFVNLEPGSQLARILLEGDYALKSLPLNHSLTEVEGYRTFPQWARSTIGADELGKVQTNRLWISLDGAQVEIRESPDGKIASFGEVRMKVDSRTKGAGESWNAERRDDRTQAYADLLSENFDALAQRVPELHQLREAAKMVALAKWIRSKGLKPVLPEPALDWQAPEEVEGFLAMIPSHKDGRLYWGVLPSGGVDFDFDIVVTKDPTLNLESLRRKQASGRPLSRLARDAVADEMARFRRELDRTIALHGELRGASAPPGALSSYLEETTRLRQAALQEAVSGLEPSRRALLDFRRELNAANPEKRMPFLSALGAARPTPPLEDLDALQPLNAQSASGEPGNEDHRATLREALDSWAGALLTVGRQSGAALSELAPETPSLEIFMAEALGTLVAFALYREYSLTAIALETTSAEGLPAVQAAQERQSRRLDQLQKRLDALDS
jgi:hypothetical protein